jgi:hypothetical protein
MELKSHNARGLDLRSVWLLDNKSTVELCCNLDFARKRRNAKQAMNMLSNGCGLQVFKECMVPGYDFWFWFTTRAMTNIACLKNLIPLYHVTYDSKRWRAFIVHQEEFGLPHTIIDMHPCGLHIYYLEKSDEQYGFVQTVAENMKLFTKQQIEGGLKTRHLYKTLGYTHQMPTLRLCSKPVALAVVPLQLTMPRWPTRFGELPFLDLKALQ